MSEAAGAIGSVAGQISKPEGCRVVGLAGSDEKCRWLLEELGFDATINYKTENVTEMLAKHCPNGVDIYFDNVGGEILDAVLTLINREARIPLCGFISTYKDKERSAGLRNIANILVRSIKLQGFIVIDYLHRIQEAMAYLMPACRAVEIQYRAHVVEGIKNVPDAVNMLFTVANQGKLIVQPGPED